MLHSQLKAVAIANEMIFLGAIVVAEHLLIQVAEQVKRLNCYVCALQSALEQAPEVFKTIRMNLSINIRLGMVDNLMRETVIPQSLIGHQCIGLDRATCFDVSANVRLQSELFAVRNSSCANLSTALQDSYYSGLVFDSALGNYSLAPICVHEASRAANKRFVYFDFFPFAANLNRVLFVQRTANAVHHVPRRLLRDAESTPDFVGANSVLGVHDQPHADHPLIHAERRVLKDRAHLDGELLLAPFAEPDAARRDEGMLSAIAARARHFAVRPAQFDRVVEGLLRVAKEANRLLQGLGHFEGLSHV
jgi:hypothetical protein